MEPIAQGSLAGTPFAHVLLTIHQRKLDGTLALWPDDGSNAQDRVLFQKGFPVSARLIQSATTLERGLLPLFRRVKAPYAFYPTDLVGQAVTVSGRADPYALIAAALRGGGRKDVIDGVLHGFGNHRLRIKRDANLSRYAFIAKESAFIEMLRAEPQSVGELVQRAGVAKIARRTLYLLTITQALETFEGEFQKRSLTEMARDPNAPQPNAPQPNPSQSPSEEQPFDFGLPGLDTEPPPPGPESAKPSVSTPPPSVSTPPPSVSTPPAKPSVSTPPKAKRNALDVKPPPPPPSDLPAESRTEWKRVCDYALTIDSMTYYDMLEIDVAASTDAVRDAYFAKVKKWHPDRLHLDLAPLKSWADTIFHHLTEAQKTLSDMEERKKYIKSVQGGGGTPHDDRKLSAILNAAMEFQKVEVLLRRKHWDEALALVELILEVVPTDADYHATRGFILFRKHGTSDALMRTEIMKCLDRALEIDKRSERALMAKARILEREGKKTEALKLFQQVTEINPKNVDAERQIRLARMRGSTPPGKGKSKGKSEPGFLSKLFGKKK